VQVGPCAYIIATVCLCSCSVC